LKIIVNPRDELAWKRILKMIPSVGNVTANKIFEHISVRVQSPKSKVQSPLLQSEQEAVATGSTHLTKQSTKNIFDDIPQPRSKKSWETFVKLLEEITSDKNRNKPGKQIELILTSGYEQHLVENYENAEARLEDLNGLAMYANKYDSTEDFLSELALLSTERFKEPTAIGGEDVVMGGEEDELLTLTSIHQAKGLEWNAVFLIWTAEGKFPSPRSLRELDSEEEERRLWYVALTRAKDELYLTYPLMIVDYNRQTIIQKPSRFITECPPALFEIWNLEEETPSFDALVEIEDKGQEFLN
jgi:DNA helicase-2/ATP-dependent DNA helicase PcrA